MYIYNSFKIIHILFLNIKSSIYFIYNFMLRKLITLNYSMLISRDNNLIIKFVLRFKHLNLIIKNN